MKKTWIFVADKSRSRIFEVLKPNEMIEIEDFIHMEGRFQVQDLRTDRYGRNTSRTSYSQAHTYSNEVDPIEQEQEKFAKALGRYLEQAWAEKRYERIVLIAPPKFLGLLRKHLSNHTRNSVEKAFPKDLSWFDSRSIMAYVKRENKK